MQCVWLEDKSVQFRTDVREPVASVGECLVRVDLAGLCGTDLGLLNGYADFAGIPGHEFVGTVIQDAHVPSLEGKRVVADINIGCGRCARCLRDGHGHHCADRTVAGIRQRPGAFATQLSLPRQNLYVVPDNLPDDEAVLTEPVAAALRVLDAVVDPASTSALVVGAGRLGTLVAWVLVTAGLNVTVLARSAARAAALPECQIVTQTDSQFDLVVECTGAANCLGDAVAATVPRGTLVMKSTYPGLASIDMSAIVVDEITLMGSRCGDMQAALNWLAEGHLPRGLPVRHFRFRDCQSAFAAAQTADQFKVYLAPD